MNAHFCQASFQVAASLGFSDGDALAAEDRTGVEAGIHLHETDTRFGVSGHDGALHRSGTPPARQQRGVDIHTAETRRLEDVARENESVGGDYEQIQVVGIEGSAPQGRWIPNLDAPGVGKLFYRARARPTTPAGGPIWLGQDQGDREAGSQQTFENGGGKDRSPGEADAEVLLIIQSLIVQFPTGSRPSLRPEPAAV